MARDSIRARARPWLPLVIVPLAAAVCGSASPRESAARDGDQAPERLYTTLGFFVRQAPEIPEPTTLRVETEHGVEAEVPYAEYQAALDELEKARIPPYMHPDVIVVGGVEIPYYSAWKQAKKEGKTVRALSGWAEEQAREYGVPWQDFHDAVVADRTAHSEEYKARIAAVEDPFQQRFGVTIDQVERAAKTYYATKLVESLPVIDDPSEIQDATLFHWGPGAECEGIRGFVIDVNGDRREVLWYRERLYDTRNYPSMFHK